MKRTMKDSYSLWTMRKQFTLQTAMTNFLTFCMFLNTRPAKMLISRETGQIGLGESSISTYSLLFSINLLNFRITCVSDSSKRITTDSSGK